MYIFYYVSLFTYPPPNQLIIHPVVSSVIRYIEDSMQQSDATAEERNVTKSRRIEHKFQKISSNVEDIDVEADKFDEQFGSVVADDEISNLQGDFSKLSWDDSQSPTTNTLADIGQNTPDNDILDIVAGIPSNKHQLFLFINLHPHPHSHHYHHRRQLI